MILSAKDCEVHVQNNIPYTVEKPFPTGIAMLDEGYAWDCRSGQYYIKRADLLGDTLEELGLVTIYYDNMAGWSLDGSTGMMTVQVPNDVTDCYVAGLLCILTGKTQYAKYCENNPDDIGPVVPEWAR